jgi:hypothetical protein
MKKVFLVALVFFGLQTQAQVGTDLQFSQIITLTGEYAVASYSLIGTVPTGKIWKIIAGGTTFESSQIIDNCSTWPGPNCIQVITVPPIAPSLSQTGNLNFYLLNTISTGTDYTMLTQGTYINQNTDVYTLANRYIFQAIEYTVIP